MSGAASAGAGERFAFGENWRRFLERVDDDRIARAEADLSEMLGRGSLEGLSFLDAGSGSGLASLAARRLGARVRSFDLDEASVACTRELRARRRADDPDWTVERGSVLDAAYLATLGRFDVVYSWGVLHHTGELWAALGNVARLVAPGGRLFVAIYNDQGAASRRWAAVKRAYARGGPIARGALVATVGALTELRWMAARALRLRNPAPWVHWRLRRERRGMSYWHDLVDWVGGHPFEVARPEEVLDFLRARGFELERLATAGGGHACNEYVFRAQAPERA